MNQFEFSKYWLWTVGGWFMKSPAVQSDSWILIPEKQGNRLALESINVNVDSESYTFQTKAQVREDKVR